MPGKAATADAPSSVTALAQSRPALTPLLRSQLFTATAALEPSTSARPFPECTVVDLGGSGCEFDPTGEFSSHKATLVTVAFQAYGQHQAEPWLTEYVRRASPCNVLQEGPAAASAPALLNIVYLHGWFFKLFSTMFSNNVAGGLPKGLADFSGVAFSNDEKQTDVRCGCWASQRLHWN
jgi:hypothetical protein